MQNHQALQRLFYTGAALAAIAVISGCGSNFRPVVIPQPVTPPAAQPQSFAAVVSTTGPTTPGIATIIDYSGDTVLAQSPIGPDPLSFTEDANGSYGYTVNIDKTLTNFQVTSNLQAKNLGYSTLPTGQNVVPIYAGLFSPSSGLWVADAANNVIDVLTGAPETYKLSIPVAPVPVLTIGPGTSAQRNYAVSLNNSSTSTLAYGVACNTAPHAQTQSGEAVGMEVATFQADSQKIPLGVCPVYAIESPDQRRVFVLNRGSDTVTVINSQLNTLDTCSPGVNQSGQPYTCHPTLPLSQISLTAANAPVNCDISTNATCGMPAVAGPVYAEYNSARNLLVIADYDGGTISVIDVSLDEYGNDSATFGTTYTIPVGNYPASVTVLYDGLRAYVANQGDETVSIVNLTSYKEEKQPLGVNGHPWSIVSTENSQYGKVYVVSPDSPYLTIIRTDLDIVDTALLIEGSPVDVRVQTQNGISGNANNISRMPGAGQPCYLPPSVLSPATLAATPSDCKLTALPAPSSTPASASTLKK